MAEGFGIALSQPKVKILGGFFREVSKMLGATNGFNHLSRFKLAAPAVPPQSAAVPPWPFPLRSEPLAAAAVNAQRAPMFGTPKNHLLK